MNEVTKLYENCNIKPKQKGYCGWDSNCPYPHHKCNDECPYWKYENEAKYPPFTAEKQIELIKWLSTKELKIRTNKQPYAVYIGVLGNDNTCFYGCEGLYLEQTLSELINHLWQDLTEEERKQIKEVLE